MSAHSRPSPSSHSSLLVSLHVHTRQPTGIITHAHTAASWYHYPCTHGSLLVSLRMHTQQPPGIITPAHTAASWYHYTCTRSSLLVLPVHTQQPPGIITRARTAASWYHYPCTHGSLLVSLHMHTRQPPGIITRAHTAASCSWCQIFDSVLSSTASNNVQINTSKTKEMIFGSLSTVQLFCPHQQAQINVFLPLNC